jgi:hypothetical protein
MKLHLEATPAELWQKGTMLVEELVKTFSGVNEELAEALEKALPPKEQELKYPVLQKLKAITTKEYEATLKRMLADIGKVLDQSVKAPSVVLEKSGKLEKQEGEEEDKLEPGDVDPETGELIPEEDEEDEEGEEGEEEEKALKKAAPGGVERTYKVRGHPEVIDQLDALLLIANKLGSWGASRTITLSVDGDGSHFLEVEGTESELNKDSLNEHIDKDEIRAGAVELRKALLTEAEVRERAKAFMKAWKKVKADFDKHTYPVPYIEKADASQTEPLKVDFTQAVAEKDGRAYARVKRVLIGRGRSEADFEEGGDLYGYSVNQLIDLVREERKKA